MLKFLAKIIQSLFLDSISVGNVDSRLKEESVFQTAKHKLVRVFNFELRLSLERDWAEMVINEKAKDLGATKSLLTMDYRTEGTLLLCGSIGFEEVKLIDSNLEELRAEIINIKRYVLIDKQRLCLNPIYDATQLSYAGTVFRLDEPERKKLVNQELETQLRFNYEPPYFGLNLEYSDDDKVKSYDCRFFLHSCIFEACLAQYQRKRIDLFGDPLFVSKESGFYPGLQNKWSNSMLEITMTFGDQYLVFKDE